MRRPGSQRRARACNQPRRHRLRLWQLLRPARRWQLPWCSHANWCWADISTGPQNSGLIWAQRKKCLQPRPALNALPQHVRSFAAMWVQRRPCSWDTKGVHLNRVAVSAAREAMREGALPFWMARSTVSDCASARHVSAYAWAACSSRQHAPSLMDWCQLLEQGAPVKVTLSCAWRVLLQRPGVSRLRGTKARKWTWT